MFEVTAPQGALDQAKREVLMSRATEALLTRVGAPLDHHPSISTWSNYQEIPEQFLNIGRANAEQPTFKFEITTPEGVLNDNSRAGLVADIAAIVNEVVGQSGNDRKHWILLREIKDGCWGGDGRIFRLADIPESARNAG
jgi:phenylpyruvate tautomerase PptA (4-oxalocrotonate tautomerase family)